MTPKQPVFIVSISGAIGSGKTTVMKKLQQEKPDLDYFFEDVSNWKFFPFYYQNPFQFALHFQLEILHKFQLMPKQGFVVSERTTSDSKYIFAQYLFEQKILSLENWIFYKQHYKILAIEPSVVIYLSVRPVQALKRIKQRNRVSEETISLGYLQKLEQQSQLWLSMLEKQGVPVHVVNANQSEELVFQEVSLLVTFYENKWKNIF